MRRTAAIALLLVASCGGGPAPLPDYSEWLHAGVDPRAEAEALIAGLARAGFTVTKRIETERWIAIEARTADDRRAVRVVTRVGAALVLDSHEERGALVRHGLIELVDPPRADGHDLEGDGLDEIVVGARAGDRTCLLPFRIQADDTIRPVPPDVSAIGADTCVERLEDVDGDARWDGIAVLRLDALARAEDEAPRVEVPIMQDGSGRLAAPPPIAWLASERERRTAALGAARTTHDHEAWYRLAIELAALARVEGASTETQLAAFDGAIAGAVWPEDVAADVRRARAHVEAGWSFTPPPPPEP